MNTPEHLPPVATRRGLNGYFVEFRLLPELLLRTHRLHGKDAIQRNWAEFLKHTDQDEHYQALAVQSPSVARTTVHAWRLATVTGLLDQDGLTALGHHSVFLLKVCRLIHYVKSVYGAYSPMGYSHWDTTPCG